MTTILFVFLISLVCSLVLTPFAAAVGLKFGGIDQPGERKIHKTVMPRTGGMAILLSFFIALAAALLYPTDISQLLTADPRIWFLLAGGLGCAGVGLVDDFHRLGPKVKFFVQILCASIAFWGGIRVGAIHVELFSLKFDLFGGYLITVFWFLLFINAVNLVDGLDGLAAGITVFVSGTMLLLSVMDEKYLIALGWAALCGSCLGFLRYNFNPAKIFLGDGGSYFLGYMLAGLSIMGMGKAQISALTLIPLVALGVPVFDTLLAPVRRFVVGKKMFYPDAGHTHHMLVRKGLSARRAVLVIYLVTVVLCVMAVVLVNLRNERVGLVFAVLGIGAVLGMRKLGYLEYLGMDKFYGWLKDITDEAGFSTDRRTFLGMQMNIAGSRSVEELWEHVKEAVTRLNFDMVELYIHGPGRASRTLCYSKNCDGYDFCLDVQNDNLMKLELPLLDENNQRIGVLWLIKDMEKTQLNDYTFRRVEQLRRPLVKALSRMRTG